MSNKGVKRLLALKYGTRCMFCGKRLNYNKAEYHHIKPKSVGRENTEENGALVHNECHKNIHKHKYGTPEYYQTTIDILRNKIKYNKWG